MFKKIILSILLLVFTGCEKESIEWNPVFENTGFDYFYTEIDRSLSIIDELSAEAGNDPGVAQEKLSLVKKRMLEIKDYYIPLTEIRQKIYDAERFYKLKNMEKAKSLLSDSKSILYTIAPAAENKVFDRVVLDLNTMIDKVILSLDDNSRSSAGSNMKFLGEHINMMLEKGDMVLSGIEFSG